MKQLILLLLILEILWSHNPCQFDTELSPLSVDKRYKKQVTSCHLEQLEMLMKQQPLNSENLKEYISTFHYLESLGQNRASGFLWNEIRSKFPDQKLTTAWSRYVENPNDSNANQVYNVNGGDTDKGLRILKKEIEKGSLASLSLAVRLEILKVSGLDGEAAITIPQFISLGAKVNPKGYLETLEKFGVKTCLHIEPLGLEYVDGENKQKMYDEYQEKYEKFKKLEKSPLQDLCLDEITSAIRNMKDLRIGVLHQPQCRKENALEDRVLFVKKGDRFERASFLDKPLQWRIAFDGKYRGVLKNNPLKIQNKSKGFGGWCDVPSYRPLVLVSRKNFKDPQKWKPFVPQQNQVDRVLPYLSKEVSPVKYRKKEIKVLKSYTSSTQKSLIQLGFDSKGQSCESRPKELCSDYWFFMDDKTVKFIGTDLELVDAGDYDDNGESEVLFWYSGYNKDGYRLFYENFNQSVELYESYH